MPELETAHIPIDPAEIHWIWRRPQEHWTPLPAAGDIVCYRHDKWGPVTEATVIQVLPPDGPDDPHYWRVVTDGNAAAVVNKSGHTKYVQEPLLDPWVLIEVDTEFGRRATREARIRGAAGWLPLDWENRYRPHPHDMRAVRENANLPGRGAPR